MPDREREKKSEALEAIEDAAEQVAELSRAIEMIEVHTEIATDLEELKVPPKSEPETPIH